MLDFSNIIIAPSSTRGEVHRACSKLSQPPAGLGGEALVKLRLIGAFRRLPHPLVEPVGVVTDQNAPAFGLDTIENYFNGLGRDHPPFLPHAAAPFPHRGLNAPA